MGCSGRGVGVRSTESSLTDSDHVRARVQVQLLEVNSSPAVAERLLDRMTRVRVALACLVLLP